MNLLKAFKLFTFTNGVLTSRFLPTLFMGGGSAPSNTTSTVNQTNVPAWAKPQAQQMLAAATKQLFQTNDKGEITGINSYVPYSTNPQDYIAGFSPMQQQAFAQAANIQMPGQFAQGSDLAARGGYGGLQSAQRALGYGNAGFQSGQLGQQYGLQSGQQAQNAAKYYGAQGAQYGNLASQLGLQGLQAQTYGMDVGQQARNYAAQAAGTGQNYGNMVTNLGTVQQYMNPYQQAVTDVQKASALRDYEVAQQIRQANAAKAGAYGGGRQAIENAEAQRNLNTQLQGIEAQGLQNAYLQALGNIGQQQQYGLQGLNAAQTGLGTALSGGQLGLSGLAQAISGQNAAIQGANAGLAGVGQFIQGGQLGLQGTAQGMQGAGYGLQGVQGAQQGYSLANQAGVNLSNIGNQQLAAQQGIINLQNQLGAQQQANQQDIINTAINNYANAQNYPMQQLQNYNALIRGLGSTTTNYAPAPSVGSQIAGAGMSAAALYGMMKAEGGKIEEPKTYKSGGLVDLVVARATEEASK